MAYLSKYVSQINANYNAAIGYYKQRRAIFTRIYNTNYQRSFEAANIEFFDDFRIAFEEFSKNVIDQFANVASITDDLSLPNLEVNSQVIDTGLSVSDFQGANGMVLDKASIKRKLGFTYEKVLNEFFKNQALNPTNKAINQFVNIHTGDIIQKGFTFGHGGGAQIRADFAFSTTGAVSKNMEISTKLDQLLSTPSIVNSSEAISNIMSSHGYLSEKDFVGGFSVKNYNNNIAYTHSTPLMKEVNSAIASLGSHVSMEEATDNMLYVLSKHVISITSPTVLGLYKANSFAWMDEILDSNRYFFHLREYKGAGKRKRQVVVRNSAIYLQALGKNTFKYSIWQKGKGKDKFNVTIKTTSKLF